MACIPLPFFTFPVSFRRFSFRGQKPRVVRFRGDNLFRVFRRSPGREEASRAADPGCPRRAPENARADCHTHLCHVHVGSRVRTPRGGFCRRDGARSVLHAVGESDRPGARGYFGGARRRLPRTRHRFRNGRDCLLDSGLCGRRGPRRRGRQPVHGDDRDLHAPSPSVRRRDDLRGSSEARRMEGRGPARDAACVHRDSGETRR